MEKKRTIELTEQYVRETLQNDTTGHDWWHINRVRETALWLERLEGPGDRFIIELAALLHDIDDWKLAGIDPSKGPRKAKRWLTGLEDLSPFIVEVVCQIISSISFKGAGVKTPMDSIEGQIVQDADRLDALGAIGIARAFAYGGSSDQAIHEPDTNPVEHSTFTEYRESRTTTINHFHEKLLILKDRFNTESGRRLAEDRTRFMKEFLKRFHAEWHGEM